ncbi:alpha/beta fold hydrolase [uncultured Microbacterium sp.]|uniref:Hydrolase, alpha/beta hydrolase fold domain protein n=1 Tax=uncultured Microbacterium sp. TaxID=191216 RepID=A0A1Y5NU52_9MICO|nr:alpha/beta fold hydrolase [uncultured Microbacterium sp.]SBS69932.1 Hydrolase, alpha/beta hydrolase fold domain protein [uncultured Microbacterium sp.]
MIERDIASPDGRMLHAYDAPPPGRVTLALLWQHGSPQTGAPLAPVLEAAARRGIRVFSYGRPSYGGSSPHLGRDVGSAAADSAAVADALGIDRFAAMGASGGGPHALAAGLLADRVMGAVTLAGIAPFSTEFDWFAGMATPAALHSARDGRAARARFEETAEFDPAQFTPADYAALEGAWASLGADVERSGAYGSDGLIDDDVAFTSPWGFALEDVRAPVLVVQGARDRVVPLAHGEWLASRLPDAEFWLRPDDGHISVLDAVPAAMDWLLACPR